MGAGRPAFAGRWGEDLRFDKRAVRDIGVDTCLRIPLTERPFALWWWYERLLISLCRGDILSFLIPPRGSRLPGLQQKASE